MEKIRSFIAIILPDDIKGKLAEAELQLQKKAGAVPVKWVDPESIHLTLKFLGDIDSAAVDSLALLIKEAATSIPSFNLEVKEPGVFPNPDRTQVVWAGLGGETESLDRLHQNIEISLETLGFKREKRRFSPHLTLARVRDRATPDERKRLGSLVSQMSFSAGTFSVESVALMKSVLARKGAVYSELASISLG